MVVAAVFRWGVAPWLQSVAPDVFQQAIVVTSGNRDPPQTLLGWVEVLVIMATAAGFLAWRLFRTDLGERLVEAAEKGNL